MHTVPRTLRSAQAMRCRAGAYLEASRMDPGSAEQRV